MKTESSATRLTARAILAALCLLTAHVSAATAQVTSKASDAERKAGENYHHSFATSEFAFANRHTSRDAPYSAIAEKETTQILADGTRVVRRAAAYVYRDREGRTRNDFFRNDDAQVAERRAHTIYDPVGGALYFVAPQHNFASKISLKSATDSQPAALRTDQDRTAVVGGRTERLGTRLIEGVEAEGTRTTTIIASGEAGNSAPVTITYERWYAPAIKRNVLIKCTDTRFGEAVFRLTAINRSEPAPTLFALPSADKIKTIGSVSLGRG